MAMAKKADIKKFNSVWDALEEDPIKRANLASRSQLMMAIEKEIKARGLSQNEAAKLMRVTQPRISKLLSGKINEFRIDTLTDMARRLGLQVTIQIKAA